MSDVDITPEDEIQKYYEDNSQMFKSEETASAKHILVDTLDQIQKINAEID